MTKLVTLSLLFSMVFEEVVWRQVSFYLLKYRACSFDYLVALSKHCDIIIIDIFILSRESDQNLYELA